MHTPHNTPTIALRNMTRADLGMLREWHRDPVLSGELGGIEDFDTWFAYAESQPAYRVWVAMEGREPVGYVMIEIEDGVGGESVAVRPDLRGNGYGAAILRALLDAPEASDAREIVATVCPNNRASRRCHEKAGFVQDGDEPDDEGLLRYVLRR